MKAFALGCLALLLAAVLLLGACVWYVFLREEPRLEARLAAPPTVVSGEPFDLAVVAVNPNRGPVTLDSIDIDDAFLEGFQVLGVDPHARSTRHVPLLEQRTWAFGFPVAPGGERTVTYRLRPVRAGRFAGSIDVCNPAQDFVSLYADIIVGE